MTDYLNELNSPDEASRIFAAQDIGDLNRPEMALPLLTRLLVEESQAVRDALVFSLKSIGCSVVSEGLLELFHSPDAYLRNAAVDLFGTGKEETVAFLSSHLDHEDKEVRKLILDALFLIGTAGAELAIRSGLRDPALNVKITAVEYLGRLEDRESIGEILSLLERESEPMLRASILESLSLIGNDAVIAQVLSILAPDGDFNGVDPIYIPQVIDLVAKTGDLETICRVINAVTNLSAYADDIIRAIGRARHRYKTLSWEDRVIAKVMAIAKDPEVMEEVRYAAVGCLLSRGGGNGASDSLYALGCDLVANETLIYAGVRLLACSGKPEAGGRIAEIMKKTGDEELRSLCLELSGGDGATPVE